MLFSTYTCVYFHILILLHRSICRHISLIDVPLLIILIFDSVNIKHILCRLFPSLLLLTIFRNFKIISSDTVKTSLHYLHYIIND